MYGYQMLLQSPRRTQQTFVRVISPHRYASVVSLLREEALWEQYSEWTILSFETAYAATPGSAPRRIDRQVARPGTALDIAI